MFPKKILRLFSDPMTVFLPFIFTFSSLQLINDKFWASKFLEPKLLFLFANLISLYQSYSFPQLYCNYHGLHTDHSQVNIKAWECFKRNQEKGLLFFLMENRVEMFQTNNRCRAKKDFEKNALIRVNTDLCNTSFERRFCFHFINYVD